MVGVPGRSKGCSTCKRRKKRCDLQQPTCINCTKSGFVCGGYARDLVFVHVAEKGRGQYKPSSEPREPLKAISLADVRCKELNRTALELGLLNAFWRIYLPKDALLAVHSYEGPSSVVRWAQYTCRYVSESDMLRCALLALSVNKLGRMNRDRAKIEQGIELYGRALQQLAETMRSSKCRNRFDALVACRLLALYEELNDSITSGRNWGRHINGLVEFIQIRPPEIYALPGKHEIFLEARYNGFIAALTDRRPSFLASTDWTTKPWTGRTKTPTDTIMDVLVQLPSLISALDSITVSIEDPGLESRVTMIKAQCWRLHNLLQTWNEDFTTTNSDLLHQLQQWPGEENMSAQDQLPEMLAKHHLSLLYAMTLYWAGCIVLLRAMAPLYVMFPATDPLEIEPVSLLHTNVNKYCLQILRSAPYFYEPEAGLAAAMSISFPVGCVARVIQYQKLPATEDDHDEDLEHLERAMEGLELMSGATWVSRSESGAELLTGPMLQEQEQMAGRWAGRYRVACSKCPFESGIPSLS